MLAKLTAYRVQPSTKQKPGHDFVFVLIQQLSGHSTKIPYQK